MSSTPALFALLSDVELLDRVTVLARKERRATALLVAALAELDRRKLYLPQGYASLFSYCTRALHLSEHAAYNRMEAARASARFPAVLDGLEDGTLTLATIRLLAPVLTPDNHDRLLHAARHKSKRDVELLVAAERPQPDAPTLVRRIPTHSPREDPGPNRAELVARASSVDPQLEPQLERSVGSSIIQPAAAAGPRPDPAPRQATVVPLSAGRYKIQFTASRELHDKLRRVQALLRHSIPTGDPARIFERALDLLLSAVEKRKTGSTDQPTPARRTSPTSRHIPSAVKREVWRRDDGRCAFTGSAGRCGETGFLEYHHVVPFADGGPATTSNIELRCRAHNAYEAEQVFGRLFTAPESAE
jgi:hypothetical protein